MKSTLSRFLLAEVLALALISGAWAANCSFSVESITRITRSGGKSQTARDNARCIGADSKGTAHMVWTDDRDGNVEIYYATLSGDTVASEVRLTKTPEESSFPCIALQGDNVYILWQETVGQISQIHLVHLLNGKELARKKLTASVLGASCPVSAVGPDGALHVAWHEGPGAMSAIYCGKVVGDTLISRTEICTKHAGAFRPDIAVNPAGQVLVAWYEGLEIKSRLWDGKAWGDEILAATNDNREWRLSLAAMSGGKWALAWYNQALTGTDVFAKLYDGKTWYGQVRLNKGRNGFYPAITSLDGGKLLATWEDQDLPNGKYLLLMSCYDGQAWSEPAEVVRDGAMSRYSSLATAGNAVHAIWFSPKPGNEEIFHGLLRRK
jgi:hypothetical protein